MFTFLFCSVACVSFAHASDTSHRAAVEKLLLALNVQKNVSSFYEQMKASTEQMFKQMNVPENELAMVIKMRNRQLEIAKEELSWQNLKDGIINSYMKVYSEEEIIELTEVFTSPIGMKYVNKQPELLAAMTKTYEVRLPIIAERYKRIPEEIAAEMNSSTTNIQCQGLTSGVNREAVAQTTIAHVECCTNWDYRDDHFGTINNCKDPVSIKFMLMKDEHEIEREIGPGEFFDTGLSSEQINGNCTLFTACPVGYLPSVPFSVKNKDLILPGLYNCVKK